MKLISYSVSDTYTKESSVIYVPMLVLGLGGLLPFIALPLLLLLLDEAAPPVLLHALVVYGAVISTFVGALHWGYALRHPGRRPWLQCGWSVTPSLIAWVAALLPVVIGLRVLAVLLLLCYVVDRLFAREQSLPPWFLNLRALLTTIGALCLLTASVIAA